MELQKSSRSGQVMVEAVVALALLMFVWIAVAFTTYMSTNHIRTAMAARHAAWLQGNGATVSAGIIATNFFFQPEMVTLESGQGVGIGGLMNGTNVADMETFSEGSHGPFVARVTFGNPDDTVESGPAFIQSATTFPFIVLRSQVPFMPPSLMSEFLTVKSHCQWDEVGETWTDWETALKGVLNTFKSEAESFLGGFADLL